MANDATSSNESQKEKNVTTGGVLCLVTPDGDRTLRTFLGASAKFDAIALPRSGSNGQVCVCVCIFRVTA